MNVPPDITREQLLLIYNNTSDLVFLIEVVGEGSYRAASVNRAYLERTQLKSDDIIGRSLDAVLRGDQLDYVRARYAEAIANQGPWSYETRTTMRGESIYLQTTLVPVFDDTGRCTHLIGVSREITKEKLEHKALQREKQRAENYLEIAEAVIVALDREARITLLNRKGYAMLGYPEGSLTGRNWGELVIAPEKADKFMRSYYQIMETGVVGKNVNYVRTSNGERILISWANAVIRDDDGAIVGVLSSGEDITDRRRAEQAVIASQRVLAADEVVSAVAHDFNNSLQGILGNIEMALALEHRPEQLRQHLQTASKLADDAARRLKVLRSTGVDAPNHDFEPLDLHDLVEDVIAQTQPLWKDEAQRRGHDIRLTHRFSRDVRPTPGNLSELRTVLYNIVKNSIEALDGDGDGEVRFETSYDDGFNVITITDDGIGMDGETSTRIFQPFFSTKGLESGRGLGMSASHGIVRAHRGGIRVKRTAPGAGTAIEVRLPAIPDAPGQPETAPESFASPPHNILWVDDDPEVASLATSYMAALHHDGEVASGGAQALDLLRRNAYTVVITDVGMPGMNGIELSWQIHQEFGSQLPILVLTGWGDAIREGQTLPDSVRHVVSKPIRLRRLRELLDELDS